MWRSKDGGRQTAPSFTTHNPSLRAAGAGPEYRSRLKKKLLSFRPAACERAARCLPQLTQSVRLPPGPTWAVAV